MPKKRDILIRVYGRADEQSSYPVDAELDDGSYFFGGELKIPDVELLKLSLKIPEYGQRLGQALCSSTIQRALEKAYAGVSGDPEAQLRLRLCFYPDARELHAYPWERMLVLWQGSLIPLAASTLVPFSRFLQLPDSQQGPLEDRPIRLLFAVSNPDRLPAGLQAIAVEQELRGLITAVGRVDDVKISVLPGHTGLTDPFKADLKAAGHTLVEGATTLDRLIALAGHHDVVHILSHGLYEGGTASLCLESEAGDFNAAVDLQIQALMAGLQRKPRLIYLSACQTAMQDPDDLAALNPKPRQPHPMVGLAPKLVEVGVPAVLAMQDLVEVSAAHNLAAEFYTRLLDSGEVDRALSEARGAVYQRESKQWAVPALFSRLRDGRLFATDPAREAINATLTKYPARDGNFYLPLEAVSLKTSELIKDWERASQRSETSEDLWGRIKKFQSGITVVIGDSGSGKSVLLERLTRHAAGEQDPEVRTVPLLVDLRQFGQVRAFTSSRIKSLLLQSFQELAPAVNDDQFTRMLESDTVRFRFLFDQADQLPERLRREAQQKINELWAQYPLHQYVIAVEWRLFRPWEQISELLVIQPLSIRKVSRFLDCYGGTADPARASLLELIRRAELFEFAAVPWLLLHMLEQVRENLLPRSRIMVLLDWLQSALYSSAEDGGVSQRAPESLSTLAWKMQSERLQMLPLEDAFTVLDQVRGQRDYGLEDLLDMLVRTGVIVRTGDESIRFAYSALQAFGAARRLFLDPNQAAKLEEIVATLGSPNRVRWWVSTLSLLAGMMDDPTPLLRQLVFATSLTQGEQVFVAALCLQEYDRERASQTDVAAGNNLELESLRQQIYAALLWRTQRVNEPNVGYRSRAVDFLGAFRLKSALTLLIKLAVERAKLLEGKPADFEYSQVRFAAIRAIRNMQGDLTKEQVTAYPAASLLITAWENGDVPALAAILQSSDVGFQGVAAFALGDLQRPDGAAELYRSFRDPKTDEATLWATTDSLQALEPSDVIANLVLPMIAEARAVPGGRPPVEPRYERLIYLIGQLRTHEQEAVSFVKWYLQYPLTGRFKGRALVALGRLHASEDIRWSDLAQGQLESIAADDEPDKTFLQRKAIEALGELGDLTLLYQVRKNQAWLPDLDQAFFHAAEACVAYPGANLQPTDTTKGAKSNGAKRLHAGGI